MYAALSAFKEWGIQSKLGQMDHFLYDSIYMGDIWSQLKYKKIC